MIVNTGSDMHQSQRYKLLPHLLIHLHHTSISSPTKLIWRKGTPFEAMTGCTAPSSDSLLAEVLLVFFSAVRQMPGDVWTAPRIISLSPLSLATDVTLGASDLWLGTRTGAGGTATLA